VASRREEAKAVIVAKVKKIDWIRIRREVWGLFREAQRRKKK